MALKSGIKIAFIYLINHLIVACLLEKCGTIIAGDYGQTWTLVDISKHQCSTCLQIRLHGEILLRRQMCNELDATSGWHDRGFLPRVEVSPTTVAWHSANRYCRLHPPSVRETTAYNVLHTPTERAHGLALTARGGCYGDNQAHTHERERAHTHTYAVRSRHPRAGNKTLGTNPLLLQTATTKSVTPTFQVDDLRCGCARTSEPHLDMNYPLCSRTDPRSTPQVQI